MNCTKPAGPYLAILGLLLAISFAKLPESNPLEQINEVKNLSSENFEESRLEQIENITMLNIKNHE